MTAYKLPGILRWFEVVHVSQVSLDRALVADCLLLCQVGHNQLQEILLIGNRGCVIV